LRRLSPIRLGSCSFTANGWVGSFYPRGTRPADLLATYAEEFDTVELDVTWYRVPTTSMIDAWYKRTPPGFQFAAKVPQTITHDRVLENCDAEMREFLGAMGGLREKLGPLLLQFPFFRREWIPDADAFLAVLGPFLAKLPRDMRFAVEVRNREWVRPPLLDLLREHGVAFSFTDHSFMDEPAQVWKRIDPVTTDFIYMRWLGDRKGMEQITTVWDRERVDRSEDLSLWETICRQLRERGIDIFGYVNNHYGGHSPATIRALLDRLAPELRRDPPGSSRPAQQNLF